MFFNRNRVVVAVVAATLALVMLACAALYFMFVNLLFWLAVGFGIVLLIDVLAGLSSRACGVRVFVRSQVLRLKHSLIASFYSPTVQATLAGMEDVNGIAFLVSLGLGFVVSLYIPGFFAAIAVAAVTGYCCHVLMGLLVGLTNLRRRRRDYNRVFSIVRPS